jgi:hypothetical protein
MGMIVGAGDIYVGGLLESLNLRFGRYDKEIPGENGIDEIRAIQKEFGIFKKGRPLANSLKVLGVGGLWNAQLKEKWFAYLSWLETVGSATPKLSGGQAIVALLIKNLRDENPLPVYFKAHDMRDAALGRQVLIGQEAAVFYLNQNHFTVSLPMAPRDLDRKAGSAKRARK